MIKLTTSKYKDLNYNVESSFIYLNGGLISRMYEAEGLNKTVIFLRDGVCIHVTETPEEVMALVDEVKNERR